jgi:hypothetical protein
MNKGATKEGSVWDNNYTKSVYQATGDWNAGKDAS